MLSKLTFSLALVLMLAFVATSAMAQARSQLLQKGRGTVISKVAFMVLQIPIDGVKWPERNRYW